ARDEGVTSYDFLAGPDRYKTSLTHLASPLYWLDLAPHYSAPSLVLFLRLLAARRSDSSPRFQRELRNPRNSPVATEWEAGAEAGKARVLGDDTRSFLAVVRSLGRQGISVHAAPADFRSYALRSRYIAAVHDVPPWMGDGTEWLSSMQSLL